MVDRGDRTVRAAGQRRLVRRPMRMRKKPEMTDCILRSVQSPAGETLCPDEAAGSTSLEDDRIVNKKLSVISTSNS